MTGDWPPEFVGFKDGNSSNTAWDNLYLKSHDEHYDSIKPHFKDKKKPIVVETKPIRRASFKSREVRQAVEEFIKDKVLIDGVYKSLNSRS